MVLKLNGPKLMLHSSSTCGLHLYTFEWIVFVWMSLDSIWLEDKHNVTYIKKSAVFFLEFFHSQSKMTNFYILHFQKYVHVECNALLWNRTTLWRGSRHFISWLCAHFTAFHETKMNEYRMRTNMSSALQHHSDFGLYAPVFTVESKWCTRSFLIVRK